MIKVSKEPKVTDAFTTLNGCFERKAREGLAEPGPKTVATLRAQ